MKTLFTLSLITTVFTSAYAQNVGIGTPAPAELLDVAGNVNIAGQLKTAGSQGSPGQVLMKNSNNAPAWTDLSEYKNFVVYDCSSLSSTPNGNNCSATWMVPANVTAVFVECWGGGGGGNTRTGGSGGAYVAAKYNVIAGIPANLVIAAASFPFSGGSTTSFGYIGSTITAHGGPAGFSGDALASFTLGAPSLISYTYPVGFTNAYGMYGNYSKPPVFSFINGGGTYGSGPRVDYGNGGDAAGVPGSGGRGGYKMTLAFLNQEAESTPGTHPGAGGGASASGGSPGLGGRIIIHY